MSRQRDTFGPQRERRLALSGLIRQTLTSVEEREQQRGRLINVLILAQALLTLAIAPAYWGSPAAFALAAALAVYLLAFVANRLFNRPGAAAYILVFGGSLAIFAQALVAAVAGNPAGTAQAALFFITVILEAGLLFAPEVTLIAAAASTIFTAFAMLLALAVAHSVARQDAYLLIVYTLGLQALAGLIAWLLAQFILDSTLEAQKSQEIQFSQARLEALSKQVAEEREGLYEQIGELQATITRAIAGEYHARAEIFGGELSTLAETLNLLLERVAAASQAEQLQSRIQAAALPLIDAISRMGDAATPQPGAMPIITNTAFDSVPLVVRKMQENVGQRLARVQQIVDEVAGVLSTTKEPLQGAAEEVHEARRLAGALMATAEAITASAKRQITLMAQVRRMLAALLPEEITQVPARQMAEGVASIDGASSLVGLGLDLGLANPGYTGEFSALLASQADDDTAGIAPLTIPLPAINADSIDSDRPAKKAAPAPAAGAGGAVPAELVEVWGLITSADGELTQIERGSGQISRDLGVQTRHMRLADAHIAWFRQAVDTVRSNADQLQQIASAGLVPPADAAPMSQPLTQAERTSGPQQPAPAQPPDDHSTHDELVPHAWPPTAGQPEGPPTGSLRTADLIDFGGNAFDSRADSQTPEPDEAD